MQPLRKDHVDFYKSFCSKKIEDQEDSILTEIEINAQEQTERDFKNFPKLLKLDKPIESFKKKVKKYKDFMNKKKQLEDQLEYEAQKEANQLSDQIKSILRVRKSDNDFRGIEVSKNDPIDYVMKHLKQLCFDECKKTLKKRHKILNALDNKRERCNLILHTGSHITPVVEALKDELQTAGIKIDIPNNLLLPSK